jgi:hypothetical protein
MDTEYWDFLEEIDDTNVITGYGHDADDIEEAFGDGDDDTNVWDEFSHFEEPQFEVGHSQMDQINWGGDPEMGTRIGGAFSKIEDIIRRQTVPNEKLYTVALKAELHNYLPFEKVSNYVALIESVPRFWFKNVDAIAGTAYMIDSLQNNRPNPQTLQEYAKKTGISEVDLYRYYRLLSKYLK